MMMILQLKYEPRRLQRRRTRWLTDTEPQPQPQPQQHQLVLVKFVLHSKIAVLTRKIALLIAVFICWRSIPLSISSLPFSTSSFLVRNTSPWYNTIETTVSQPRRKSQKRGRRFVVSLQQQQQPILETATWNSTSSSSVQDVKDSRNTTSTIRTDATVDVVVNDKAPDINHDKYDTTDHFPVSTSSFSVSSSSALDVLAASIVETIVQSDVKRTTGNDGAGSSGWTSWIDAVSSQELQTIIQNIQMISVTSSSVSSHNNYIDDNDERRRHAAAGIRWLLRSPQPVMIDWTSHLQNAIRQRATSVNNNNNNRSTIVTTTNETTTSKVNSDMDTSEDGDILQRIGLHCIVLPSDMTLSSQRLSLSVPGSMIYGKLLYGGVTRYRVLPPPKAPTTTQLLPPQRKVGERTCCIVANDNNNKNSNSSNSEETSWLQFGGPNRNYQAMNIGPCLLFELTILPVGVRHIAATSSSFAATMRNDQQQPMMDICVTNVPTTFVTPQDILELVEHNNQHQQQDDNGSTTVNTTHSRHDSLGRTRSIVTTDKNDSGNGQSQQQHSAAVATTTTTDQMIRTQVGGLQNEIDEIVRRVLDGRQVQGRGGSGGDATETMNDMKLLSELGLHPVRGLLLFGPPGCGKTHLARQIASVLTATTSSTTSSTTSMATTATSPTNNIKLIAAPELLDRWIGGTERLVRELFADAERELQRNNGDATQSSLHVIIIDEIDAVFRQRSSTNTGSEITRASAVNQILSKLDGVQALGNVLLIGLTNRRELLDPALLRPGRLEVQIEIGLPNMSGRREILQIHFAKLRQYGRLSTVLCHAIDGTTPTTLQVRTKNRIAQFQHKLFNSFRRTSSCFRWWHSSSFSSSSTNFSVRNTNYSPIVDLASDEWTEGFSGADLAGLVRNAGSIALDRLRNNDNPLPAEQIQHPSSSSQQQQQQQQHRNENDNVYLDISAATIIDGLRITLYDVECALQEIKATKVNLYP